MKCFIIILGASSLLSYLPLEPIPGPSIWYNFCSAPIELRRDGTPEEIYKKKKQNIDFYIKEKSTLTSKYLNSKTFIILS